jgi:hypothetical protein
MWGNSAKATSFYDLEVNAPLARDFKILQQEKGCFLVLKTHLCSPVMVYLVEKIIEV